MLKELVIIYTIRSNKSLNCQNLRFYIEGSYPMKYFIAFGNTKKGPYSLEEVKEYKIERNTLIWKEGLENWMKAEDIEELQSLFISAPPPIPGATEISELKLDYKKKAQKEFKNVFALLIISLAIALLTLIIYSNVSRPEYVSDENISEGKKAMMEDRFKHEPVLFVGRYIPDGKYSYGLTTEDIEDGNVNEIVRSRFRSDVTNKTLLAFGLSFGVLLVGYFITKGVKLLV